MLLQKFLLLSLPVLALAANTSKDEEEELDLTTTTKAASSSKVTAAASSSLDEDEEEENETTTTTTAKSSKSTSLSSSKDDEEEEEEEEEENEDDEKNSKWPYEAFGSFITELPECTRGCFETPISPNVTENCAKLDNWNCICHFYKPSFYKKVFNDTPIGTSTETIATEEPNETETETETEITEEELAQEDFFICIEDACGIKKWGYGRDEFFDNIEALNTYCETEEKVYDEARNKKDYKEIEDAKKALEAKKAAEDAKNAAGHLGVSVWGLAATAVVGLAAFAL